ncbi:MAG: DUF695 domain-containing protein [Myxococcota bacterium]|nr:DUF695 domain-containing protein [Myxococcota bacterium]
MQEHWEHYRCSLSGQPATILVDLSAMDLAPDRLRPLLVTVRVRLKRPQKNGLNSPSESAALQRLEELLVERLERAEGRMVGRVTHGRAREFNFYVSQPQGVARLTQAALDEAGYRGSLVSREDPEWQHYRRFLWPERAEMQAIVDRRMVQALRRKGDVLRASRPVEHWVAFESVESRDAMLLLLDEEWEAHVRTGLEKSHPVGLCLTRHHQVDLDSVREVTSELTQLSEVLGGRYEAWRTALVRQAVYA